MNRSPNNAGLNSLALHKDAFLEALQKQGYAKRTLQGYRLMTERLCAWVKELSIAQEQLDAATLNDCAMTCPQTGSATMARDFALVTGRFIDFLVETGAIAARPAVVLSEPDFLIRLGMEFDDWLRTHRGMGAIESDAEIESVRQAAFRLLRAQYSSH